MQENVREAAMGGLCHKAVANMQQSRHTAPPAGPQTAQRSENAREQTLTCYWQTAGFNQSRSMIAGEQEHCILVRSTKRRDSHSTTKHLLERPSARAVETMSFCLWGPLERPFEGGFGREFTADILGLRSIVATTLGLGTSFDVCRLPPRVSACLNI
jgi:hypothetical protein